MLILVLTAVAVVLGYAGFASYAAQTGRKWSALDILYRTAQLFALESGAVEGPVPWRLEVARVLAPLATAGALLGALGRLFADRLVALRLARRRGHVVICGLGRKGLRLAADFRAAGEHVVVIECDEQNDRIDICRDSGAVVLLGDAAEDVMLRKARAQRADRVAAICGDDGTNVEIAVRCHRLVRDRKEGFLSQLRRLLPDDGSPAPRTVQCHVQAVDAQLCDLFRRHRLFTQTDDRFEARIFNTFENAARLLFRQHPPDGGGISADDPRRVHVVIFGFGRMGQAVAAQAAKVGHYANGRRVRVSVIDREAGRRKAAFYSQYAQFDQVCDVDFHSAEAESQEVMAAIHRWAAEEHSLVTAVVCLDGDSQSLSRALKIAHRTRAHRVPIFVRMAEEAGLAALLDRSVPGDDYADCVQPFGLISHTATRELLLKEELDQLARAIHEEFATKRIAEGRPAADPSVQEWRVLKRDFKDSNRQQADHIEVKLRAIGCGSLPLLEGEEARPQQFSFSPDEVELLARMEHARWCGERLLAGWTRGSGKDDEAKTHPDLVPWDKLSEEVKGYDRDAVRLIPRLLNLIGKRVSRR